MAHSFMRPSGAKRATSLMLSIVMLATMVMPAFAAPVVTPSNYKPGTLSAAGTNLTSVDGTGSAGYLGVYSFEVTGTPATRAYVQSNAMYQTDASKLVRLSDLNVPPSQEASTVPVISYSDDTTTFPSPVRVTGLTSASTITDVVNAINAQFAAYMTASFDGADRIRLTAKKVGNVTMGITDGYNAVLSPLSLGMADAAFRGVAAPGDWLAIDGATSGTAYSAGYGTVGSQVRFKPLGGKEYNVDSTIGYMAAGVFTPGVDPATGFHTAIKLGVGHDFVIRTSGAADVRPGVVSFEAADGVRAPVVDGAGLAQGTNWQAGQEETITVVVRNTRGLADATNGARVVLPAGFTFASPDSVTFGAQLATVTVSADRSTMEFTNFQSDNSGDTNAPASVALFTAEIRVKNATASDNTLGLNGSLAKPYRKASLLTRNVAGTAWTQFGITNLRVYSEDRVARVGLLSTEINAGGFSKITGQLFDQYNNEIVEFGRAINFDLASSTPTPTGSFVGSAIPTQAVIATGTPISSPFTQSFKTSVTPGENVIRAMVLRTAAGTETVAAMTTINTRNVGNPYQVLVLEKDGKTSFPTTGTPTFYVKVVDQAGKGTSFLTPRKVKVVKSDKYGSEDIHWADITAGYSTSADFNFGSPQDADTWKLTATDWYGGAALPSNVLSIDFSGAIIPGAPYEMKVSAVKPIPGQYVNTYPGDLLFNYTDLFDIDAAAFGYANADGQQAVEFTAQVVDEAGRPVSRAGIEVTFTVPAPPGATPGVTYPGVLSAKTGVTDANGQVNVKVKVTSTVGSREHDAPSEFTALAPWWWGYPQTTFFTPVSFETTLPASEFDYGFAYFVKGKLTHMVSDKPAILADGTDAATITMHVMDQAFGMPAAGVPLALSTSAGSLSSTSVVTGADGKATVSLKSNSVNPSSATVVAVDPDGNRLSLDVRFSDLRINVAPVGSGTAQGGHGASQDVRISFSRLDGTPVLFSYWDATLSFEGGSLYFSKWETATAEGGVVLKSAAIYTATLEDGNAIGSWNVEVADVSVSRYLGIFGSDDYPPQMASTKLNFVNNATFSAKLVKDSRLGLDDQKLSYVGGSGFNAPANGGLYRYVEVGLPNGDNRDVEFQRAQIRPDGSIVPMADAWAERLNFLMSGMSYDLRVDGIIIKDALVVSDWVPPYGQTAQIYAATLSSGQVKIYGVARELLSSELRRGASVDLQVWTGSEWVDNALTDIADSNGEFSWTLPVPARNSVKYYRVRVQAAGEHAEAYSFIGTPVAPVKNQVVKVMGRVNSIVRVDSPSTARANVSFLVKGSASSSKANEIVTVKVYKKSGTRYVLSKTYSTKMTSVGTFSLRVTRPAGYYKIVCFYNYGSGVDYTSVR